GPVHQHGVHALRPQVVGEHVEAEVHRPQGRLEQIVDAHQLSPFATNSRASSPRLVEEEDMVTPAASSWATCSAIAGVSWSVPSTYPRISRCWPRAFAFACASRIAGMVTPTGSAWAPNPSTKSSAITPTCGSSAS